MKKGVSRIEKASRNQRNAERAKICAVDERRFRDRLDLPFGNRLAVHVKVGGAHAESGRQGVTEGHDVHAAEASDACRPAIEEAAIFASCRSGAAGRRKYWQSGRDPDEFRNLTD